MNLTALATHRHDKNDALNLGAPRPKSGWQLSARLDWALALPVSPSARFVAVAIVKHTGAESAVAWPSQSTLSGLTGYSKATVKRAVRELEKGGHFDITRLKIGRKSAANRYRARAGGWGQSDPRGGVRVTPEPVISEPVISEPVRRVHTARAQVSCEQHGRTWFESDGLHCHECARDRTRTRARPEGHRIPESVSRQLAARSRVTWNES